MRKKILSLFLVMIMVLGLLPNAALATGTDGEFPSTVFDVLSGKATVEYGHTGSFKGENSQEFVKTEKDGYDVLQSNNQRQDGTTVTITITVDPSVQAAELSFWYKVSSEASGNSVWDGLKINDGDKIGGEVDWTLHRVAVTGGDTVTLAYTKDFGGKGGEDCVYLRDFRIEDLNTTTFTLTPQDAEITLAPQGSMDTIQPQSRQDGSVTYALANGTYAYTVSKFGYESDSGTINVPGDSAKAVTLTQSAGHEVTFSVTLPEGLEGGYTIHVLHGSTEMTSTENPSVYHLPAGEYTYAVSHPNCGTVKGGFTVGDRSQAIPVTLVRMWVVSDYFAGLPGFTAENGEDYGFVPAEGGALKSSNQGKSKSEAQLTLSFTQTAELSFQYKVSSEPSYDKFTVTKNNSRLVDKSGRVDWTDCRIAAARGDVIVLAYSKDSGTNENEDTVWLKDFSVTSLYKVTFTGAPAGAAIVVSQNGKSVDAQADGSYLLKPGSYTYTVTAFGYVPLENQELSVTDADREISVSMEESTRQSVSFQVTKPEGITGEHVIQVWYGEALQTAADSGAYRLPAGTYRYTITCQGCDQTSGTFTVGSETVTVSATLLKALTFDDIFSGTQVFLNAQNDGNSPFTPVRTDEKGGYLQSANTRDGSKSSITLAFRKPARLSFQYWLSENGSTSTTSNYGLIVEKNGRQVTQLEGISKDWETCTLAVNKGETISITYSCHVNNYSMTEEDGNFLRVKNFAAMPLYALTFTGTPEGAAITVSDQKGAVQTPYADRLYLLEKGNYSYTVSAFGYERKSGTMELAEASSVDAALEQSGSVLVTFQIPQGASVTLSHEAAGDLERFRVQDTNQFNLPKGEYYTYTVTEAGCLPRTGSVTADKAQTVTVEKLETAGQAWDGSATKEPGQTNGVYQIGSAEELAWFAQQVNGRNASINGTLTANINLGGQTWTGIGSYSAPFTGTFDGGGHTVSGLAGASGLFDTVGTGGTVKHVAVIGTISGSGHLGGIANTSYGAVEDCSFAGSLTSSGPSFGSGSLGGIVGRAQGAASAIRNCISIAELHNHATSYMTALNTGGIVGYAYGPVEDCAFIGTVAARTDRDTNTALGGLVGQLYGSGSLSRAYFAGSITGPAKGTGAAVGTNAGTISKVYVPTGTGCVPVAKNTASTAPDITEKTAADMKADRFAYDLGTAFRVDGDGINGGYPVLAWQGGRAPVVTSDEETVSQDLEALVLKDEAGSPLKADSQGRYPVQNALTLALPKAGEKGSAITWSCTPDGQRYLNLDSGALTLPDEGTVELVLTAAVSKGNFNQSKPFTLVLQSVAAQNLALLEQIKSKAEESRVFIQPLQAYNHTNIRQTMEQYLMRQGYTVDMRAYSYDNNNGGIRVEFVSPGEQVYPGTGLKEYIGADGAIGYYTGEGGIFGLNYAQYQNVTFRLWMGGTPTRDESAPGKPVTKEDGVSVEVKVRVHIGWDGDYLQNYLSQAVGTITWDTIRGTNRNAAQTAQKPGDWWDTVTVDGQVSNDLTLPVSLSGYGDVKVKWSSPDTNALYVTDNGDGTYTATLNRPPFGGEPFTFTLTATATFNRLDDYTRQEAAIQGSEQDWYTGIKNFVITVAPNDVDQSAQINTALEQYPTLLRDFVDKSKKIDTNQVTDDLQMPTPGTLEQTGIMPDRYNQKATMVSGNTDVLEFNGYHAMIYRPLPGEDPVTVTYTVMISDRRNGATLGQKTFELTVLPLTEEELQRAETFMKAACTAETYWNGIKGGNSTQNNVTGNLTPFAEILPDGDGGVRYVYGAINLTFGGTEVDDLPGYDPMNAQPWREYRSSRPTIVTCENLLVNRPDYDTEVTLDSVLTHSEFGKYWEKFGSDPRYARFERFYKQPVSITITVKGTKGTENPDPTPQTIQATVSIDGGGFEGFHNTGSFSFTGNTSQDWTVWDALDACFRDGGYTYRGSGYYISAVTDSHGVTLEELEHGTNSGWMYTVNGKLPELPLNQVYLHQGDSIRFFYTGDYHTVPGTHGYDKNQAVTEVEKLISAIGTVTEKSGAAIQAARAAYDALPDAQKKLVSNYDVLTKAEQAYAALAKTAPFTDVGKEDWFYQAVQYVHDRGLMGGTGETIFDPDGTMTRAMLVAILYRLEGEPKAETTAAFRDVPADTWYTNAVAWATGNHIVNGVGDGRFAPADSITREQMAAMLYRYAQYKGYDPKSGADLSRYTDAAAVSGWALDAIRWASGEGLITGRTETTVAPGGTATRAEAAAILMRFLERAAVKK